MTDTQSRVRKEVALSQRFQIGAFRLRSAQTLRYGVRIEGGLNGEKLMDGLVLGIHDRHFSRQSNASKFSSPPGSRQKTSNGGFRMNAAIRLYLYIRLAIFVDPDGSAQELCCHDDRNGGEKNRARDNFVF